MRRAGKIILVVTFACAMVACVNSEEPSPLPPGTGPTPPVPPVEAGAPPAGTVTAKSAQRPGECTVDDLTVSGPPNARPQVQIPDNCSAPSKLASKNVSSGSGPPISPGSSVSANYVALSWSNGQPVDSSWTNGSASPVQVKLDARDEFPGWNEGLVGIRQGARRLLVVPPQANGAQGALPVPPNETVVFVIDALGVNPAA